MSVVLARLDELVAHLYYFLRQLDEYGEVCELRLFFYEDGDLTHCDDV